MSGTSVSVAHEEILGPLAGRGPAGPNGHRQRAPEGNRGRTHLIQ